MTRWMWLIAVLMTRPLAALRQGAPSACRQCWLRLWRQLTLGQSASPNRLLLAGTSDQLSGDALSGDGPREGSLRLKVRQHVNPLTAQNQQPLELPSDWLSQAFSAPTSPLLLDIGCAKGSWALQMAQQQPMRNFLGLEIRRPVVDLCLRRKAVWHLNNIHFLQSNANVDLENILRSCHMHQVNVDTVTIQFPDPHFKSKHKKRRLVNADFVRILAEQLSAGARIFIQSDVDELQHYMIEHFLQAPSAFRVASGYDLNRLETNGSPFSVQTEREIATINKGLPVYRMLFEKHY